MNELDGVPRSSKGVILGETATAQGAQEQRVNAAKKLIRRVFETERDEIKKQLEAAEDRLLKLEQI